MCHILHLTHWSCMNSIMRFQSNFAAFSISRNIHTDINIFNSINQNLKKIRRIVKNLLDKTLLLYSLIFRNYFSPIKAIIQLERTWLDPVKEKSENCE